ncbi:unnamed protein product [Cuscuta campestris]|uniref:Uncharacterized protein n=1 Tax=Cuscuta campestris TaxID=132261 RepID=A0A484MWG4_9ASTE|nr:unnamed protein product [Cuscuta campestris]
MSPMSQSGTHLPTCDPPQNSSPSNSVPDPGKVIGALIDHGSELLAEDCGLPIVMNSASLGELLCFKYCLEKDLLQVDPTSFSIDEESSPKFAQYYYSLCCQGRVAGNTLLLLN